MSGDRLPLQVRAVLQPWEDGATGYLLVNVGGVEMTVYPSADQFRAILDKLNGPPTGPEAVTWGRAKHWLRTGTYDIVPGPGVV